MVTYQFEIDDDTWNQWKNTVPRSQSLEERLIELIEADTDGRVSPPTDSDGGTADVEPRTEPADTPADSKPPHGRENGNDSSAVPADLPNRVDRQDAQDTFERVREFLRSDGPASTREIVAAVMPEYPLGYDVPELVDGELVDRYRGAWWRKVVKPSLDASAAIEYRSNYSDYRFVGGPNE